ncbi:MAG: family 1 glycosylhydrolase [Actinomycetota bacterium]|nr:family 1 glycosylhydrolase [Actinomycetota bacterium]
MIFPEGFWLGTGSSSVQLEGAAETSDWGGWERERRVPPSRQGAGFADRAAADLALVRDLGLDHVRLTLEWARIEPANGEIDGAAVDRYRDLLATANDLGLAVWVTLVDGSLPGWFAVDERGWRDERARNRLWPRHVEQCAEHFGDLAAGWVPIARPTQSTATGHLGGSTPPGDRHLGRFRETLLGVRLAQLDAWRVLRGGGAPVVAWHDVAIGRAVNQDPEASAATARVDETWWGWLEAYRDGIVRVPETSPARADAHRDAFDVIGLSWVGSYDVDIEGGLTPRPDRSLDDLGLALRRVAEDGPDRPIVLFGERVGSGDDGADRARLAAKVRMLAEAVDDGVRLVGSTVEPFIDGYEWAEGFAPGRGLLDADRTPRATAELLGAVARGELSDGDLAEAATT